MFPQEGRLRNFTYSSAQTVDLKIKIIKEQGKFKKWKHYKTKIHIGKYLLC